MMKINDTLTSNHQIIADNSNKYFVSIATIINNNNNANNINLNSSKIAHQVIYVLHLNSHLQILN
jgi:uncharacterized lipoprotein NlpE involved in copper resistance